MKFTRSNSALRRLGSLSISLGLSASISACCIPIPGRRDGGPTRPDVVADAGFTLLCRERPAWTLDPAAGLSADVDSRLYRSLNGHFGNNRVQAGVVGPPVALPVTAGGGADPIDVGALGLRDAETGETCNTTFVARRPDRQVVANSVLPFMRMYAVTQNGADPVLLVRRPDGRWRCNNNHGQRGWGDGSAAVVDFCFVGPGLYTVWVGTSDGSANNLATLYVTGNPTHHP